MAEHGTPYIPASESPLELTVRVVIVGILLGASVGDKDGILLGALDGDKDGKLVGEAVGSSAGIVVGTNVVGNTAADVGRPVG